MEFDLPTIEQLYDAAVRLRDELDDETDPTGDGLVTWPWISLLNILDYAHRLDLVRAAELPEQPISRDGAGRKLDYLLPLLRAQRPAVVVPPATAGAGSVSVSPPAAGVTACPVRVVPGPAGRVIGVLTSANVWRAVAGLTDGTVDVLALLVAAYPDGLTANVLKERSTAADPCRALRNGIEGDADLAALVCTPGTARRGGQQARHGVYRIRSATTGSP